MADIPKDYEQRVYAGVLGKIIGVYLGRPFEGWSHEQILDELGEIRYYVHEQLKKPLIVVDDDISGTFTFLRAMSDYGCPAKISPTQIGQTWLNYLIEEQTVLWWGGMGNSTEHTAYLRLKNGIPAPKSGSRGLNGKVVAEQIGAQIFIDGWGMISPGDPERAAALARCAGSVSHDGEALYGAQVIAAMEAQAFLEPKIPTLLDVATSLIPADSLICRLIGDLRDWHAKYPNWKDAFACIQKHYGYDTYGGNCHIIPNHAVVILALLYSQDSFSRALTIVNTAGWDTDCNSGNVGCLMGIKNGLKGLDDGPDLRGPVADRMYIPTADAGRTTTDALHEAFAVSATGRQVAGQRPLRPKGGARFHFDLPGAVQAFLPEDSVRCKGTTWTENVAGHSQHGDRSLAIHYQGLASGRISRVGRETFPDLAPSGGYRLVASPSIYPGQIISARLEASRHNSDFVVARLIVKAFGEDDALLKVCSPAQELYPGAQAMFNWPLDLPSGCPAAWIGVELESEERADGTVYLDWLTWDGPPNTTLGKPTHAGSRWLEAWTQSCSEVFADAEHTLRIIQNKGEGLLLQGAREWQDYVFCASMIPHLAKSFGIAVHVQGLQRYYALKLTSEGKVELLCVLDGVRVLAERTFSWDLYRSYDLQLFASDDGLVACINDEQVLAFNGDLELESGAIALMIEEGRVGCSDIAVRPLP